MFEVAELGQKLEKDAYDQRVPELREALLDVQTKLKESRKSATLILIGGVEGSGKGDTVNKLLEWFDARGIFVHGFPTSHHEDADRPRFFQFWKRLPAKGEISIFLGSWYTQPVIDHSLGIITDAELEHELNEIVEYERMLSNEGVQILKFWLHISKKEQRKKLKRLEADADTRWRVTKRDWQFHRMYDRFINSCSRALRMTSTGFAPWDIVEGHDRRFRYVTVAESIHKAIAHTLEHVPAPVEVSASSPVPEKVNIINSLKLEESTLNSHEYDEQLEKLQSRLGQLARQLEKKKISAVLAFEGSDAAGKGGCIRRISHALDARYYRIISVAAPTEEERARPYLWRFWRHVPRTGHLTIFDRSWYGRVLVERIEGFCSTEDWQRAYAEINAFEEQLVESNTLVLKFWLSISNEEQLKRFQAREATGYKRYKITEEDWRNRDKWGAYEAAACDMIEHTSTEVAPWTLVEAEDKRFARIKVLKTLVSALEAKLVQSEENGGKKHSKKKG